MQKGCIIKLICTLTMVQRAAHLFNVRVSNYSKQRVRKVVYSFLQVVQCWDLLLLFEIMYRVVIFPEEQEVAVVSSQWWNPKEVKMGKGEVLWPPCKSAAGLNRALSQHPQPDESWSRFPGTCVFITGETWF